MIYPNWLMTYGTGPCETIFVDGLQFEICENNLTCEIHENNLQFTLDDNNLTMEIENVCNY